MMHVYSLEFNVNSLIQDLIVYYQNDEILEENEYIVREGNCQTCLPAFRKRPGLKNKAFIPARSKNLFFIRADCFPEDRRALYKCRNANKKSQKLLVFVENGKESANVEPRQSMHFIIRARAICLTRDVAYFVSHITGFSSGVNGSPGVPLNRRKSFLKINI